jgi:ParB-like chromosome segregation protein Spo0J
VLPRRIQPLVIDLTNGKAVLIDGRNRREACKRAGITPHYTLLTDGEDLSARILSENVHRRHLTKSQRAIVVAQLTRNWSVRQVAEEMNQKRELIRQARFVLRYGPDLADSVRSGALSLDNAYEEARIRKGRAETYESRFNALKATAPDLAEMVVEEKLALEEAEAARRARLIFPRRLEFGRIDDRQRVLCNDFIATSVPGPAYCFPVCSYLSGYSCSCVSNRCCDAALSQNRL